MNPSQSKRSANQGTKELPGGGGPVPQRRPGSYPRWRINPSINFQLRPNIAYYTGLTPAA